MARKKTTVPAATDYPVMHDEDVLLPGVESRFALTADHPLIEAVVNADALGEPAQVFAAHPALEHGGIGTVVSLRIEDINDEGTLFVHATGVSRARLQGEIALDESLVSRAMVKHTQEALHPDTTPEQFAGRIGRVLTLFNKIFAEAFTREGKADVLEHLAHIAQNDPLKFTDLLAGIVYLDQPGKLNPYLQITDPDTQLTELVNAIIDLDIEMTKSVKVDEETIEHALRSTIKTANDKLDELGLNSNSMKSQLDALALRLVESGMPEGTLRECEAELADLRQKDSKTDQTAITSRRYLEKMASLPWVHLNEMTKDLPQVRDVLDAGHYGMQEPKKMVLELVSRAMRSGDLGGLNILLSGPPGIGKTTFIKAMATALGLEYIFISLNGVNTESALRGHIRTFIDAREGIIMEAMLKAKTRNPLIHLDEVDKMGFSEKEDPESALRDLLDRKFSDNLLGKFDFSQALIVATANNLPKLTEPTQNRFQRIEMEGYFLSEKMYIAREHILPKQLKKDNLTAEQFSITDEALRLLIKDYTFEPGMRDLETLIDQCARKAGYEIQMTGQKSIVITPEKVEEYLDKLEALPEFINTEARVGHVNALAVYDGFLGVVLHIKGVLLDNGEKNELTISGTEIGDTMKDSFGYTNAFVQANAAQLGIPAESFNKKLHVKVSLPQTEGPSAGIAFTILNISLRTGIKIRSKVTMTGELDTDGEAGIIGGLAHKLEAAHEGGADTVIIPAENIHHLDLRKFPKDLRERLIIGKPGDDPNASVPAGKLRIIPVNNIWEVLPFALERVPVPFTPEQILAEKNKALVESIDPQFIAAVTTVVEAVLAAKSFNNVAPRSQEAPVNDDTVTAPVKVRKQAKHAGATPG